MTKSTTFSSVLQTVFPREQIEELLAEIGYVDVARKFTGYDLFLFLAEAALQQWKGYRDAEPRLAASGLKSVDHSTLSKKAKDVPFELFKRLFQMALSRCSRPVRRHLNLPKELLLLDSTQIVTGKSRLPWAPLSGEKSGVKLHVSLLADGNRLHQVEETDAKTHDSQLASTLSHPDFILVADRAYSKHKRFDDYEKADKRQLFVIRLRDTTRFQDVVIRERKQPFGGSVEQDFTCRIGQTYSLTEHRFRVVELTDPQGKPVVLATNLHWHSPERIAEIYKARWQIEVFFHWIKQHLNVSRLFGTTPNAVYGQLYMALFVYVLLKFWFEQGNRTVHLSARLSLAEFDRLFKLNCLPVEWIFYFSNQISFPENS
ncbi:IS4 family transposase [Saccharibacillus kuerlensis]|uniref:IS4 family transposase ISDha3 n=3 Tax=Saccharibacillus kuerlensis TaxID=459527 RepID=A0ABQ2L8P7_9BACL|nr:IS4 family transposase [Saccharibacillus kuerlensis]GGO05152.1 IS4 family transposase ISDha3 [Saccharibacillus kuerlensis]